MIRNALILALAALLTPLAPASAADEAPPVPNINKRGEDEKAFVQKLANIVVTNVRTSVKSATVKKYEKKEPRAGRTEFVITAAFKGAVSKKDYTANIVVHVDSADKDKWEVTRIEYTDDVKPIPFNRKNVDNLVNRLNGKAGS